MRPALCLGVSIEDAPRYVNDDEWVGEQKLDGRRLLTDGALQWGRDGQPVAAPVSLNIPSGPWVLDGEVVDGIFWVFDIVVEGSGLDSRHGLLEAFVETLGNPRVRLVPRHTGTRAKQALLNTTLNTGAEGVVFKQRTSLYRPGRGGGWVKVKYTQTADVIVVGVGEDGKASIALGVWRDNDIVPVGRCSSIGRPPVRVGDVIEVRYLYVKDASRPRLYQPVMVRIRDDKQPHECDGSEFKVTNGRVLT